MKPEADVSSTWQKIESAERIDDPQRRAEALEDAIQSIQSSAEHSGDASALYAIGYAWYMHPRRLFETKIQESTEAALQAVVGLRPHDALAWMYLGHNAYDLGQYDLAQARFARVDTSQTSDYLRLKVEEMLLCCEVLRRGLGPSLGDFEAFVRSAEMLEPIDVWPQQLARLLATEARRLAPAELLRLQNLAQRLDRAGDFGRWFQEAIEISNRALDN